MKIAGNQPYLFPYIGYFQLINQVDYFAIADDFQYIEKGWINRNNLLINDKPNLFTFSVSKESHDKNINERYYDSQLFNKQYMKLLNSLKYNYKKAKNYNSVLELLDKIFSYEDYNVSNFNFNSIKQICEYLNINTKLLKSSELKIDKELKREERVLKIIKLVRGTVFINAIGGMSLYSKEWFEKENIALFFLKNNVKEYIQFSNEFVPNLSIIDVLMHNSIEETNNLLKQCILV